MKTVNELTIEELEELRDNLYYQLLDDPTLSEEAIILIKNSEDDNIPISFVKEYYADTSFVSEDFWTNVKFES